MQRVRSTRREAAAAAGRRGALPPTGDTVSAHMPMTTEEQGEYLRALALRTGDPSIARLVSPDAAR